MGSGIEFKSDDHFHSFMSQMMGKIYIDKISREDDRYSGNRIAYFDRENE